MASSAVTVLHKRGGPVHMPREAPQKSPRGLIALALFLLFGAAMAALAGATLVFPGTILDRAWRLNSVACAQVAPLIGMRFFLTNQPLTLKSP